MVKDESGSEGTIVPLRMIKLVEQAHQEVQETVIKEKSNRMTLYKGTLEGQDLGDDEPHIEPARIPLNTQDHGRSHLWLGITNRPRRKPQLHII